MWPESPGPTFPPTLRSHHAGAPRHREGADASRPSAGRLDTAREPGQTSWACATPTAWRWESHPFHPRISATRRGSKCGRGRGPGSHRESEKRQGAVTRVARQLGIGPASARNWAAPAEIDGGTTASAGKRRWAGGARRLRDSTRDRHRDLISTTGPHAIEGSPDLHQTQDGSVRNRRVTAHGALGRDQLPPPSATIGIEPPDGLRVARDAQPCPQPGEVVRRVHTTNAKLDGSLQ